MTAAEELLAGSVTARPTNGGQVSLEVTSNATFAANPQMKAAESLVSDFEHKNPGIKVKLTTCPRKISVHP